MTDIINWQTLTTAIVVAIPTSLISASLAIRRYRTERWWDKKADCYVDTVNAMDNIIRFCDIYLDEALDGKVPTDITRKELADRFHKGKRLLQTQTNIGHLLMSEDAYKDLLSLDLALSQAEREEDIAKQIAGIRGEVEDCLYSFIPHAKNDLGVRKLNYSLAWKRLTSRFDIWGQSKNL